MQNKRRALRLVIFWALAIGWVAVLFIFSGQTGAESGELSLWLTHLVQRLFPWIPLTTDALEHLLRKLAHFSIFAVEGFLLCLAMMESFRDKGAGALLSGILCTAVADRLCGRAAGNRRGGAGVLPVPQAAQGQALMLLFDEISRLRVTNANSVAMIELYRKQLSKNNVQDR